MGGVGEIYYVAISRYAGDHGITGSAFDNLVTVVRAMDRVYVEWRVEQAEESARRADKNR